ncbi:MAG TPA: lycopene cyclase domain-containing protein [Candidatus Dormibacteraeota bacterium]|jgi:lycopene cyclase domain-containing protein|nr:lycopene cyclase domain-containing protein [Candidatus Dormibacteraeota bacterium]
MWGHLTYLGLLLPWALPVLALQWAAGHSALRRRLGPLLVATLLPTAWLIAGDAVALAQGIWTVHRDRILGVYLGNVPLEEAVFFLLTDLMVVQSVLLLNAPEMRPVARRALRVLRRRPGWDR